MNTLAIRTLSLTELTMTTGGTEPTQAAPPLSNAERERLQLCARSAYTSGVMFAAGGDFPESTAQVNANADKACDDVLGGLLSRK